MMTLKEKKELVEFMNRSDKTFATLHTFGTLEFCGRLLQYIDWEYRKILSSSPYVYNYIKNEDLFLDYIRGPYSERFLTHIIEILKNLKLLLKREDILFTPPNSRVEFYSPSHPIRDSGVGGDVHDITFIKIYYN